MGERLNNLIDSAKGELGKILIWWYFYAHSSFD